VNATPIHRLAQDFHRSDVNLSSHVMYNWVIRGSEVYRSLIYDWMKKELLSQPVMQADETTLKVKRGPVSLSHELHVGLYHWRT
jgi:hypothetical protein